MDRVSRPLIGLLVATVAFFALWITMLKPSDSTTGGTSGHATGPGLGQLNSAIAAAHGAVATANATSAAHGGVVPANSPAATAKPRATAPQPSRSTAGANAPAAPVTHRSVTHATVHRARPHRVHRAAPPLTPAARLRLVARALERRQVLAMLFYNPAGADDQLVRQELATVPSIQGAVVKLAIPLSELASYSIVTRQVPVTGSPTLVIVDPTRAATEIVGFAGRFEIAQRIDDALAVR